jgi:hypothetical protein
MQPSTVNAVILKTFKEKNNWVMTSKLLEDLDHSMIRSAKNISESMIVLDKLKPIPGGYKI